MKYGCCVNILPKSGPKTGIEYVQKLKDIGYDYVELPLNELSKLSNAEFDSFLLALQGIGFPCSCCNDFMPSSFRIVGEKLTSTKELQNYLELAMARLKRLGAAYSVFGSPWSRNCPDGFSKQEAFQQIADFLHMAGEVAAANDIVIAVEHNNHEETNMLNHFSDAVHMVKTVSHPNVKVLCDYYHLRFEQDTPSVLSEGKGILVHTHIAQLENRKYLTDLSHEPMLTEYAAALHQLGYQGGISIEGRVDSPEIWETEARLCLSNLKAVFE